MNDITTTDLSKFGYRERQIVQQLLKAWDEQGLPEEFADDQVTVMFNTHSGNVFLTNADFQVAMMNDEKLEMFYSCPNCGNEGFDGEEDYEFKKFDGYCSEQCLKA